MGKEAALLVITAFAHTLQLVRLIIDRHMAVGPFVGLIEHIVLEIMSCYDLCLLGSYLIALCVGNDTDDDIFITAGIRWHHIPKLRTVEAFTLLRLCQLCQRLVGVLTVLIVFYTPGVGQLAEAKGLYPHTGDVRRVVGFIGACDEHIPGILGLLHDHDLGVLDVTADGALGVLVIGMAAYAQMMVAAVAVNAFLPVLCHIPGPAGNRPGIVLPFLFGMLFLEVGSPAVVLDTDPIGAITALEVGIVLTADKTQVTVVANALAIGAVFLAVFADIGAIGASAATGTELYTIAAQIAVLTHIVCAFAAAFAAFLADVYLFTAGLAARAMVVLFDGAVDTQVVGRADVPAACADLAFLTLVSAVISVAFIAIRAVQTFTDGALHTDDIAHFRSAVVADFNTFLAELTFLTPVMDLKITATAVRTMSLILCGAIHAQKTLSQTQGAAVAHWRTIFTGAAFHAPGQACQVAGITIRAMAALIDTAFCADIELGFLVGAALADLVAGAIGTDTALNAQADALCALIALAAVGRAVDPLAAFFAGVTCKDLGRCRRDHSQKDHQRQQCAQKSSCHFRLHLICLLWAYFLPSLPIPFS